LVSTNPVRKVKLFPERPNKLRVVSYEEFQKVYNTASDLLRPIFVLAVNRGIRRGDIQLQMAGPIFQRWVHPSEREEEQ
jgi:hypothetical protein